MDDLELKKELHSRWMRGWQESITMMKDQLLKCQQECSDPESQKLFKKLFDEFESQLRIRDSSDA